MPTQLLTEAERFLRDSAFTSSFGRWQVSDSRGIHFPLVSGAPMSLYPDPDGPPRATSMVTSEGSYMQLRTPGAWIAGGSEPWIEGVQAQLDLGSNSPNPVAPDGSLVKFSLWLRGDVSNILIESGPSDNFSHPFVNMGLGSFREGGHYFSHIGDSYGGFYPGYSIYGPSGSGQGIGAFWDWEQWDGPFQISIIGSGVVLPYVQWGSIFIYYSGSFPAFWYYTSQGIVIKLRDLSITHEPLPVPTFTAIPQESSVLLLWNASTESLGISGPPDWYVVGDPINLPMYDRLEVQRSVNDGPFTTYVSYYSGLSFGAGSWEDPGAGQGSCYSYKIRGVHLGSAGTLPTAYTPVFSEYSQVQRVCVTGSASLGGGGGVGAAVRQRQLSSKQFTTRQVSYP